MKAEIRHRWGGHRGRPTEWEITSTDAWLHEVGPTLPVVPGAWTAFQSCDEKQTPVAYDGHSVWIILDEGNTEELALEIVRAIIREDEAMLVTAIKKVKAAEPEARPRKESVAMLWRPDDGNGGDGYLDGRWGVGRGAHLRDELPDDLYGGQDPSPPPFFADTDAAVAYLEKCRPHQACQVELEAFRRRWPEFEKPQEGASP